MLKVPSLYLLMGLGAFALACGPSPSADKAATQPVRVNGPVAAALSQRVISLAPNITESVFAIGAGDRVVGVTDFCKYPSEATQLQRCGGWSNPSLEILSALKPDLIIVQGQHDKVREFGRARGIAVEGVEMDSVASILAGLEKLGRLLDCEQGAQEEVGRIRERLAVFEARQIDAEARSAVFISIGRQAGSLSGVYTAAGGSFLDEALTLAGGRNIFADVTQPYPQASRESLISRSPDVILELAPGLDPADTATRDQLIADWQILSSIPAVRDGRIYVITDEFMLNPGPRVTLIIEKMQAALQAE